MADTHLPPVEDIELLSENGQAGEALMLGLRLRSGISSERVESLMMVPEGQWRRKIIQKHIQNGFLKWDSSLRLTPSGLMVADSIIGDLLMDETSMVDTTMQDLNAKK
jgi:coproporphyrinogen III oxidase-like Fe-S oxidoreductase